MRRGGNRGEKPALGRSGLPSAEPHPGSAQRLREPAVGGCVDFMSAPDDRIQRSLDGLLSPEELSAFQADVVSDASLREAYVDQVWLHASLRAERDSLADLIEELPGAEEKIVRRW